MPVGSGTPTVTSTAGVRERCENLAGDYVGVFDDHSLLAATVRVQYLLWAQLLPQILPSPAPHEHRSWIPAVLSIVVFEEISMSTGRAKGFYFGLNFSTSPGISHI